MAAPGRARAKAARQGHGPCRSLGEIGRTGASAGRYAAAFTLAGAEALTRFCQLACEAR